MICLRWLTGWDGRRYTALIGDYAYRMYVYVSIATGDWGPIMRIIDLAGRLTV